MEDEFDDAFAPRGLLEGAYKQEVDVGARRELPTTVTACRHDRDALGFGRILRIVEMLCGEVVENLDQQVLQIGEKARGDNSRCRTELDARADSTPRLLKIGLDVRKRRFSQLCGIALAAGKRRQVAS